ncbi:MAG TPA: hypothetical protein DCR71_00280 [Dehalococcoidia bacterium]|nr:hypothetical protein [Dehalococcoidia bacterium]HAS27841.1 hypothetical protein [Dehalococcoidia bacterium]
MDNIKIAVIILIFPILLSAGIFTIPYVLDYSSNIITELAVLQSGRWLWGHIISALAFGWAIIVAHYISRYLYYNEQNRIGTFSLYLTVAGGILMAAGMGADGIGPVATVNGGAQASVFFEGSGMIITIIFMVGIIVFGFGLINQIIGLGRIGVIPDIFVYVLIACAILFMGFAALPSSMGLYCIAYLSVLIYGCLSVLFCFSET